MRRLVTPGRGIGGSSIGKSLILFKDVESLVRQAKEPNQELTGTFIELCRIDIKIDLRC